MTRTRYAYQPVPSGTIGKFTSSPDLSLGVPLNYYSKVVDEVLPGDSHPFAVTKYSVSGGRISKPFTGYYSSWAYNYLCYFSQQGLANLGSYPSLDTGSPSDASVASTVLSKTNPSKAYVDLPVGIAELRELPEIIRTQYAKSIKEALTKGAATSYLTYQFGLKPFVDDMKKMLNFHSRVEKRVKEIKHLQRKGLRRTIDIGGYSATTKYPNTVLQSSVIFITRDVEHVATERVWGHVRYRPAPILLKYSNDQLRALAYRAVLGLTVDFNTAYQLIPWSWLVDWFSNLGDIVESSRNIVPVTHDQPLVMRHVRNEFSFPEWTSGLAYLSPGKVSIETKSRKRVPVTLSVDIPFLTKRQSAILASIAALRGWNPLARRLR